MSASADTPRIIVQALEPHYREAAGQWARRLGLELAEEGAADPAGNSIRTSDADANQVTATF